MNDGEKKRLKGVVVFLRVNEGSKSESVAPFLYQGKDARPVPLFLRGDNPFENGGLSAYDGMCVEVAGATGRGDVFEVEDVSVSQQ